MQRSVKTLKDNERKLRHAKRAISTLEKHMLLLKASLQNISPLLLLICSRVHITI